MLDLDARVHLDEEPVVFVHVVEEFDGARIIIADALGQRDGGVAEFLAHFRIEVHRRRDFDDFLIAPLHRTIALVQMDDIAVLVTEDLHLDVFGSRNVAFEENGGIAKGIERLVLRLGQQARQQRWFFHHPHATATAAESRFDDQREADFMGGDQRLIGIGDRLFRAGQGGNVELVRQRAGRRFVAHVFQKVGRRADESDAFAGTGAGECGVFGEETIAGVNHRHALLFGQCHDALHIQVGADRALGGIQLVRLVRLESMDGKTILLGKNGYRRQAELGGGSKNTNRDFAAVCGHQFSKASRFF